MELNDTLYLVKHGFIPRCRFYYIGILCTGESAGCTGILCLAVSIGFPLFNTRVIPHFGHFPGLSLTTSGCMGQVYTCCCTVPGFGLPVCAKSPVEAIRKTMDKMINFFIFFIFYILINQCDYNQAPQVKAQKPDISQAKQKDQ
jgi:hypothetical protein